MQKISSAFCRVAMLALLASLPFGARAVSVGEHAIHSALGEPLHIRIPLFSVSAADLIDMRVGLASRAEYARTEGRMLFPDNAHALRFRIKSDDGDYIAVTTREAFNEPALDLLVSIVWSGGNLLREYQILVDPPNVFDAPLAQIESPTTATVTLKTPTQPQAQVQTQIQPEPEPEPALAAQELSPATASVRVRYGDTLSGIAYSLGAPPYLSEYQVLAALKALNPHAFVNDNMNRLKSDVVLQVPTFVQIASFSDRRARRLFALQLKAFNQYRAEIGWQDPNAEVAAAPQPKAEAEAEAVRLLTIGRQEEAARNEQIARMANKVSELEESVAAANAQNAQLQKTVAELQKQKGATEKLLELANTGLAVAQQAAEKPTPQPAKPEQPAQSEQPAQPAQPARKIAGNENVAQALDAVIAFVAHAIEVGMMTFQSVMSNFESTGKIFMGLGALLLLLLLFQRRRAARDSALLADLDREARVRPTRRASASLDIDEASELASDMSVESGSALDLTVGQGLSVLNEPGTEEAENQVIEAGAVDPLAEAEVYLAYDRDEQAIEVLSESYAQHPERIELAEKLLEIYHKQDDRRAFDELAAELKGRVGIIDAGIWGRIAKMGREVSPNNPDYADSEASQSIGMESLSGQASAERDAPASQVGADAGIELDPAEVASSGLSEALTVVKEPSKQSEDLQKDLSELEKLNLSAGGEQSQPPSAEGAAAALELAKAYIELGEKDIAKGFIEEVITQGDEKQRQEAEQLIQSVG